MTVTDRKTVEKFLKIPSTQEIVADLLFSPHEDITVAMLENIKLGLSVYSEEMLVKRP